MLHKVKGFIQRMICHGDIAPAMPESDILGIVANFPLDQRVNMKDLYTSIVSFLLFGSAPHWLPCREALFVAKFTQVGGNIFPTNRTFEKIIFPHRKTIRRNTDISVDILTT